MLDEARTATGPSHSSSSSQPVSLPPSFPTLPPRTLYLPSVPSLLNPGNRPQYTPPSATPQRLVPTTDQDFRRLLLLQTLASRQHHNLPVLPTPTALDSLHLAPPSPDILSFAPTPPPNPLDPATHHSLLPNALMPSTWAAMLEGFNALPASPSSIDSSDLQGGPGTGAGWTNEAQQQLDLWSQLVFTSNPASPTSSFSPPATHPPSQAANLPPDPGFDWTTLFPPPSFAFPGTFPTPFSSPGVLPTPLHPPLASSPAPATTSESPSSQTGKNSSRATGNSQLEEREEEEVGSPEEIEEKRKRNTAASARFRAKKKERDTALRQTSAGLREKVGELEKEAASLKAENKWLRDLVSEKAEMDPRLLTVLRVHPEVMRLAGRES